MSFAQLDGESDVEVDGQEKEEGANELGRLVGPAPFSYLTLYFLTFNKSSDPKWRTYQIFYLVQGTLRFPVISSNMRGGCLFVDYSQPRSPYGLSSN